MLVYLNKSLANLSVKVYNDGIYWLIQAIIGISVFSIMKGMK